MRIAVFYRASVIPNFLAHFVKLGWVSGFSFGASLVRISHAVAWDWIWSFVSSMFHCFKNYE